MLQSLLALPDAARKGETSAHPHSPDPLHPIVLAVKVRPLYLHRPFSPIRQYASFL